MKLLVSAAILVIYSLNCRSMAEEAVNSTSQASIDAMENEAPVANMTSKDPTIARPNEAKFEAKLSSLPSKVSVNDLTAIATAAASAYKQYMSATAEKAPRNEAPVVVRTDKSPKVVSKDKAPIVASENKTAVLGSTYTAAVVEMQANESQSTAEITERFVKIIQSREVNEVDILIFPELIVNSPKTALLLPNSTSYCDDANAHFFFRKISCAVRKVPKYVLVNLYVQINCSLDDQAFCAHNETSTNVYNMAIVFDRHGDVIAKYRKFNLFSEVGTQAPAKPDLTTFRTDFNVTFGVFICFDLLNKEPAITLVNRGIRHFVHPAMWYATLPYYSALQYQQSWAIANNVNLLAANGNDVRYGCTGSGIYSGRTGALEMFVSEQPATKILIAKVPKDDFEYTLNKTLQIGSPKKLKQNALNNGIGGMSKFLQTKLLRSKESALKLSHEDFTDFSVHFLDFSRDLNQTGRVCNRAICCDYNIEVNHVAGTDSTSSFYYYAISVYNGRLTVKQAPNAHLSHDICSLITCTKKGTHDSCGQRIPDGQLQNRYTIKKLSLVTILPLSNNITIMANTLTNDLHPIDASEWKLETVELEAAKEFVVEFTLLEPKTNLVTFAIVSRDYNRDLISAAGSQHARLGVWMSVIFGIFWIVNFKFEA